MTRRASALERMGAVILELDGHRVEVARDGAAGVAIAFIDSGLLAVDSSEVARRIRAVGGEG